VNGKCDHGMGEGVQKSEKGRDYEWLEEVIPIKSFRVGKRNWLEMHQIDTHDDDASRWTMIYLESAPNERMELVKNLVCGALRNRRVVNEEFG
jgi:hypothetical protein